MKVLFASVSFLANKKTMLVHFVLLPLINVLLLTSLSRQFGLDASWQVAFKSILLSASLFTMNIFSESFIKDQMLGIDRIMVATAPYSLYFWLTKSFVSMILSLIMIVINMSMLWIVSLGSISWLDALMIAPLLLLAGLSVAWVAVVGSWKLKNPYIFVNIINYFSVILGGVLIDIHKYPLSLAFFSSLFPFANILLWFDNHDDHLLLSASLITLTWFLVGLLLYYIQLKVIKKGTVSLIRLH